MAHWLGGWCVFCAELGFNGALVAVLGFEDWVKMCDRCGRTPERAAEEVRALQILKEAEATLKAFPVYADSLPA